jgi:hypothetical protein
MCLNVSSFVVGPAGGDPGGRSSHKYPVYSGIIQKKVFLIFCCGWPGGSGCLVAS